MNERLEALRAASLAHLRSAGNWLAAHRFWVESGALAALALITAYAIGSSSLAAAAEYEQRASELAAVSAGLSRWVNELEPPTSAESATWAESEQAMRTIDAEGADPTTIARIVAARAQEAGINDLSVRLLAPEEISAPPPVEVGDWSIQSGNTGVAVGFVGDWSSVIGFLGSLPPQVEVSRVVVEPGPEFLLRVQVVLLAREVSSG